MMENASDPLAGGLAIGLAATVLLLTTGRIAGISGIVWGGVTARGDRLWRWLFLAGLIMGPLPAHYLFEVPVPAPSAAPWWVAVLAGVIVGYGTRLGGGCTSGHGVCGLGRMSVRSLVATLTFMGTGVATVFIVAHVLRVIT